MVVSIVRWVIEAYVVVLFLRAILSWFPISQGSALVPAQRVLMAATEPVLAPMRRVIPPLRMGGAYLDLSIIIVIVVLEVVSRVI